MDGGAWLEERRCGISLIPVEGLRIMWITATELDGEEEVSRAWMGG